MSRLLVVQHDPACGPGLLGGWLEEAGVALDVRAPGSGDHLPEPTAYDGLMVMGGPMGAESDDVAPWLPRVREQIRTAASASVPTLGICLGHQLCAVALGGRIAVNPRGQQLGLTEVGWQAAAATDPLLGGLRGVSHAVHWNDDIVVELPAGATVLARTDAGELQAARFAPTVWGLQWHPEVDDRLVAPWAELDRARYDAGVVDARVAAIGAAAQELSGWSELGTSFAAILAGGADGDVTPA